MTGERISIRALLSGIALLVSGAAAARGDEVPRADIARLPAAAAAAQRGDCATTVKIAGPLADTAPRRLPPPSRDHEKDAPATVTELLLFMGDIDGAAASFVRRLGDPRRRVAALRDLSDYDALPVTVPAGPGEVNLPTVKARADVQAAIARAGGVRRIPLQDVQL